MIALMTKYLIKIGKYLIKIGKYLIKIAKYLIKIAKYLIKIARLLLHDCVDDDVERVLGPLPHLLGVALVVDAESLLKSNNQVRLG